MFVGDAQVKDLVKEHGLRRWAFIASCLQAKTQKQVYARWRDYLQPGISSKPWTKQEQRLLVSLHAKVRKGYFPLTLQIDRLL